MVHTASLKRTREEWGMPVMAAQKRRLMPAMPMADEVTVKPGMYVRVLPSVDQVTALHAYPFYGANPCPASRCGWAGLAIETGTGMWRQGVKIRFADGMEWCYNPKALVIRQ